MGATAPAESRPAREPGVRSACWYEFLTTREGAQRWRKVVAAAAYPPATYEGMAAVKRDLDPDNVFALNHTIAAGDTPPSEGVA